MKHKTLHTPEGVRDIHPIECRQKLVLQEKLHRIIQSYGYQDIQTPTLEFSEIFNQEVGSIDSKELYRFFDREGNILVLRPDITPSISRAISITLEEQGFRRLCYMGNTFINHNSYQGRLKENTQLGAEMLGINSIDIDGEMIALAVEVLKGAGLEEFQISLSHVAYYNGLIEAANLDMETEKTIRELCENKNYFGVTEVLDHCNISPEIAQAFAILPELVGGVEILGKAKLHAPTLEALEAIERLENIANILEMYGVLSYVTFDLSMTGTYGYYTGIVFKAYTFGTGDAILKGGRYDQLMSHFGAQVSAIGFALTIDELQIALERQKIEIKYSYDNHIILYDGKMKEKAIKLVKNFRENGRVTEMLERNPEVELEEYVAYGKKNFGKYLLYINEDRVVTAMNLLNGSVEVVDTKLKK